MSSFDSVAASGGVVYFANAEVGFVAGVDACTGEQLFAVTGRVLPSSLVSAAGIACWTEQGSVYCVKDGDVTAVARDRGAVAVATDGSDVIWTAQTSESSFAIERRLLLGAEITRVTDSTFADGPSYVSTIALDAESVYFGAEVPAGSVLVRAPRSGGDPRIVVTSRVVQMTPSGDELYFTAVRDRSSALLRVPKNGGEAHVIAPGEPAFVVDDRHVYLCERDRVARISRAGGEAEFVSHYRCRGGISQDGDDLYIGEGGVAINRVPKPP